MLTPVRDHHAPAPPPSAPIPGIEPAAFPASDGLRKLMRADSARRFADFREANRGSPGARPPRTERGSLSHAAARLKDATTYYKQHVLAWYALGRVNEARAAREAIAHCRQALAAETRHTAQGADRRRQPR